MNDNTTVLTPPAPEVKAPEAPKPPEAIKAENQKAVATFAERFAAGQPRKNGKFVKAEDAAPVAEPELDAEGNPVEPKPAAAAPAKPKKAAPKKPEAKPEPAAAAPDYEKIAEAAARGVATAIAPKPAEKKEPEKPNYDFMSEDEREELPVLEQMEKSNPAKYKGLVTKFTDAIKARQEYESKWLVENPGKEFDPDAEEHNDFFAKNDVDWKDRDYAEAIADIKVGKMQTDLEKNTDKKIGELTARDKARELEPIAIGEAKANGRALFTAIGDEYKDILSENGTVNQPMLKKLFEADPVKFKVVTEAATALETLTAENVRLFNNAVPFDQNNRTHTYLNDYAAAQEKAMEQLTLDEKKNGQGQMFAPLAEYYKMPKKEQAKHWTFSAKDLNTLLAADHIKTVKETLAADEKMLEARATKRGFTKAAKTDDEPEPETPPAKRGEENEKPLSPSSVEAPVLSSNRRNGGQPLKGGLNSFLSRGFGR